MTTRQEARNKQSRNPTVIPFHNAKKIVDGGRYAAQQNELNSSQLIAPYILIAGEADMDERTEAISFIARKAERLLNRFFLPPAIGPGVEDTRRNYRSQNHKAALDTYRGATLLQQVNKHQTIPRSCHQCRHCGRQKFEVQTETLLGISHGG